MIVFNGIELDLYKGSLKPPILKKSLASLQNLEDRKGTVSTEFNIPRTPKNELAFNNATVAGSNTTAIGEAIIYIDGNVYEQGTLYLKGFNDNDLACLFIGSEIEFISKLNNTYLVELFEDFILQVYDDTVMRAYINSAMLSTPMASLTAPVYESFYNPTQPTLNKVSFHLKFTELIKKICDTVGLTISSNFMSSDYFQKAYYSFKDKDFKSSNNFDALTNTITTANQIVHSSLVNGINDSVLINGSGSYVFQRDTTATRVTTKITIAYGTMVKSAKLQMTYGDPSLAFFTSVVNNNSILIEGENLIDFEKEFNFLTNGTLTFNLILELKSGATFPLSGFSFNFGKTVVSLGDIVIGERFFFGDYVKNIKIGQVFKDFLNHFNLVYEIVQDTIYIEPKDDAIDLTNNNVISGFANSTLNITADIKDEINIEFFNDIPKITILKSNYKNLGQTGVIQIMPQYPIFGFVKVNETILVNSSETISLPFEGILTEFDLGTFETALLGGIELANKYDYAVLYFDGSQVANYINQDLSTTTVTFKKFKSFEVQSDKLGEYVFKNTLNERGNTMSKTVRLFDHLGTKINFRTDYIIDNQVYKLVSYEYNLETKLVNAKMILKNG